jgi:hypothetical protein
MRKKKIEIRTVITDFLHRIVKAKLSISEDKLEDYLWKDVPLEVFAAARLLRVLLERSGTRHSRYKK